MVTTVTVAMPTVVRNGAGAADTTVVDVGTSDMVDLVPGTQDLVHTPDLARMADLPDTAEVAVDMPHTAAVAADTRNTDANKSVSPEESPFGLTLLWQRRTARCGALRPQTPA
jgi:hypothetical protein